MPFTTLATANSTIGPAQYADMAQALAPRFLVDSPGDLRPYYSNGNLVVQPGAALVCGTRVRATSTNLIQLPPASAAVGVIHYVVVLRVDWSKSPTTAANLVYLTWPAGGVNKLINTTATPDTSKINRIPGVLYDAVIARVIVGTNVAQQNSLVDFRLWGGDGGPLRVANQVVSLDNEYLRLLDARAGAFISTDQNMYTLRLDDDGVWRSVGTASNPWKRWTPTLRFYGNGPITGTSGGTPVALGTQGTYAGYYRVTDGMLDGFVQVTTGTGNQFGTGPITMDLPLPCANWMADTWSMGHIYTDRSNGGDGLFDWHAEVMVKAGWTRGQIFAPVSGDYNDLKPHMSSLNGPHSQGVPHLNGGWSVGSVYTFHLSYPVQSLMLSR